eukprot:CAMPEP_0182609500 /NCGR_PEP_ID=MMETSP1330-20130603/3574_1 /TAXON_ID=464278 /ORGANISM="Picochlorum sp., Strain RCC944" /LENGTH=128 /DNA_ID=CAMNT_0024828363 /DNA_START=245 /DNA_END=631 /DNA_ORIENTATION=+
MSSTSIPTTFPVAGGKQQCHRVRLNGNSNSTQSQRKKVPAVPGLQNFGRVDHYFQSHSQNSEQQHGSEFLKQLFQYPHSSCIAVQGGGTEGYVVNRAFITEAQQTQAKLLEMVQSLQRENEKLKSNKV